MNSTEAKTATSVTRRGFETGFSLIELLIVVAIILVIAAIAIPNLLRAKIAANESSAVNSIRTYTSANVAYSSLCPLVGYPNLLSDLGPGGGACAGGANLVDPILGSVAPNKAGYTFTYVPAAPSGTNTNYILNAAPANPGTSGIRYFFCDETGVIRYSPAGPATVASPPL